MKRTRLIYLAQPYRHSLVHVMRQRAAIGARVAGTIIKTLPDTMVYAPIPCGQAIHDATDVPIGWDY